jgi:hypothetical protein
MLSGPVSEVVHEENGAVNGMTGMPRRIADQCRCCPRAERPRGNRFGYG